VVFLAVYVDGILLTVNDLEEIQALKSYLDHVFKIKDLGEAHYFLGLEILQVPQGLVLTQRKFAKELLEEFGNPAMAPVLTSLDSTQKLGADDGDPFEDPSLYRTIVGKLNFLTNTRPDFAFIVQHLSQFMEQPCVPHFKALLHVLRYLKHNSYLSILLNNHVDVSLTTYYDSDWAACVHTRRSISGYLIFFRHSLISWKSKKQGTVALSSTEAEYRSLSRLVAELA